MSIRRFIRKHADNMFEIERDADGSVKEKAHIENDATRQAREADVKSASSGLYGVVGYAYAQNHRRVQLLEEQRTTSRLLEEQNELLRRIAEKGQS